MRVFAQRHERDDVDRADARVGAGVLLHVDQLEGASDRRGGGADHRLGRAREGHHAAVVGLVARVVEQRDAVDLADGRTISSTTSGRRPSEKFGTHSIRLATDRCYAGPPQASRRRLTRVLAADGVRVRAACPRQAFGEQLERDGRAERPRRHARQAAW